MSGIFYPYFPALSNPLRTLFDGDVAVQLDLAGLSSPDVQYEALKKLYFEGDEGAESPLIHLIQIYQSKEELGPNDLEYCGVDASTNEPYFRLSKEFEAFLWQDIDRLQTFLFAFGTLAARDVIYTIDPHNQYKTNLSGAHKLAYLDAAWKMLHARLTRIPAIYQKYDEECRRRLVASPVTTDGELYNPLPSSASEGQMMLRSLYVTNVLSDQQDAEGRRFKDTWEYPERFAVAFSTSNSTAITDCATDGSVMNTAALVDTQRHQTISTPRNEMLRAEWTDRGSRPRLHPTVQQEYWPRSALSQRTRQWMAGTRDMLPDIWVSGSSSSHCDDSDDSDSEFDDTAGNAPGTPLSYRQTIPAMAIVMGPSDFPSWDDDPATTEAYLAEIGDLSGLGGTLSQIVPCY